MNLMPSLRRYSLALGAAVAISLPVGTVIGVKTSLFKDTELSMVIEEYGQQGLCRSEPSRLEKWCAAQENTLYGLTIQAVSRIIIPLFPLLGEKTPPTIKETCEEVRRDQHYYQEQLQQFFTHLDRDSGLRMEVEKAIYSSTQEIPIDVFHRRRFKRGRDYAIESKKDHSDALYRQYISILKGDEQLQKLLHQVTDGEDRQQEFLQRARDLMATFRAPSSLEMMVKENLLQAFKDGAAQEGLAELYELAAEAKVEEQKSREVIRKPRATAEYKKQTSAYIEWRKTFPEKLSRAFWNALTTNLVHHQITRVDPLFNPELLAYGHTHPNVIDEKYQNGKEAGPSPIDLREKRPRPELIFTPYADKWLIHQVICGESTLAREYSRSIK